MHSFSAFVALLTATSISAVPLNINLGAYSPALVVGDGEISFRGAEDVAVLVETLPGAPTGTTAATANAGITRAGTVDAADDKTPTIITPAASASETPSASSLPAGAFGIGRSIGPRLPEPKNADTGVEKRDLTGFTAALNFATGALKTSPGIELGTGGGGSGVGIKQAPGIEAAATATAAKVGKRDDGSLPTVTLLKIRTLGSQSKFHYFRSFST
jgi:hypothetical protein